MAAMAFFVPLGAAQAQADAAGRNDPGKSPRVSWGAQYGEPLRVSASLTIVLGGSDDVGATSGLLLQLQPGVSGGRASLGYGFAWFDQGLPFPALGGAVRATVLRTWGRPLRALPDTTFAGMEADLNFAGVKGTVGRFWRVGGAEQDPVTTWGVGVGF